MIKAGLYLHYYVNNWYSALMSGLADMFSTEIFERVNKTGSVNITTNISAVERLRNRQDESEPMNIRYPLLVFHPNTDIEPDPVMGRLLWHYPRYSMFMPGVLSLTPEIYRDKYVSVNLVFNRYVGSFDVIIYCSSFSEMIDFKILALQLFGGPNRYSRPSYVDGVVVLPDELRYYEYTNPYYTNYHPGEELRYVLNWDEYSTTSERIIRNINQNKRVYLFQMEPLIKLRGVSEESDSYASPDALPEFKLTLNFDWEAIVPCHLIVKDVRTPIGMREYPNYVATHTVYLDMGCSYRLPIPGEDKDIIYAYPSKEVISLQLREGESNKVTSEKTYYYIRDKFMYIITEEDDENIHSNPPKNIEISLSPEFSDVDLFKEDKSDLIRIYGKFGMLTPEFHWFFDSTEKKIKLVSMNMEKLKKDDVLWIVLFKKVDDSNINDVI